MIFRPSSQRERENIMAKLRVIDTLRGRGADYVPVVTVMTTPVLTIQPKPRYL